MKSNKNRNYHMWLDGNGGKRVQKEIMKLLGLFSPNLLIMERKSGHNEIL